MTKARKVQLGEDKLLSSGLTLEDAKILGIECIDGDEVQQLYSGFRKLCAIKFNYYGVDGKPVTDWPKGGPFFRLRFTEKPTDFSAVTGEAPRYVQMPNTAPMAYYPRNVDWAAVAQNTSIPIIITEGELKAAKACKEGFPTIGIGGVHSWQSHKLGLTWIPSLDEINWVRRHVYITFDSDYRTNENVCHGLHGFAEQAERHGSFVYLVSLPSLSGLEKTGLDDFLVHNGIGAAAQFREMLEQAEPLGLAAPLWKLNGRFVYIANPGLVLDQLSNHKIPPAAFKEHHQSTALYQERQLRTNGTISYKPVSAAASWLKWPLRQEAAGLTYAPGAKQFVTMGKNKARHYNTWPGWGCEAALPDNPGNPKPFLDLIDHLFDGSAPEDKQYFLRWLAYPLQNPGKKMYVSAVLWGIRHGTGKSLVGYTMGKIYGKNFTEISAGDLHGNFNEWAEGKQFVLGDDVASGDQRKQADALKKMITQLELRVNAKFIPTYTIPDCINYLFTSNHSDAFFIEDDDRRFAVFEVIVGPLEAAFYTAYGKWLEEGGAEAVFGYLCNLDLGDFNPAAPAPKTEAKVRMIVNNKTDIAAWVLQLMEAPDTILRMGEMVITKDLFTSKELLLLFDPIGKTRVTANGIGRELLKCGVRQVYQGRPVKLPDGSQSRYYAIRNPDLWLDATPGKLVNHLVEWMERQGERVRNY